MKEKQKDFEFTITYDFQKCPDTVILGDGCYATLTWELLEG